MFSAVSRIACDLGDLSACRPRFMEWITRLLDNYSFPAEVIYHYEIQSAGKEWGVSVWEQEGPCLLSSWGKKRKAHFTVWPREQMFHVEVPFSKMTWGVISSWMLQSLLPSKLCYDWFIAQTLLTFLVSLYVKQLMPEMSSLLEAETLWVLHASPVFYVSYWILEGCMDADRNLLTFSKD